MLNDPRIWVIVHQFLRFAAVGAIATLIHYSILISLMELGRISLVLSTSVGFTVGAVVSYTLNRRITFDHQPHFGRGLFKFVAIGAIGLGLNALIVSELAAARTHYILAQMVATGVVLVWNFIMARLVIFRTQPVAVKFDDRVNSTE